MAESRVRSRVAGRELTLSNLDKVLYPATGFTKAEVIDYYARIAPVLLAHVCDRCLTRLRFPAGVGDDANPFYEKNAPVGTPEWVRRQRVVLDDGDVIDYVVAEEPASIVWLANLAALELHVPQWRISSASPAADGSIALPEDEPRPGEPLADLVVVDLDPGPGMSMIESARAALLVASELAADGLIPVAKTSGGKGLQVYAAISPVRSPAASAYVKEVGRALVRAHPDFFVISPLKVHRPRRIFVDYSQNHQAKNTIAAYSLRGRERPSIATPVTWEEVGQVQRPDDLSFTPEEVLQRVAEFGDLAADLVTSSRPPLPQRGEP